ncbi:hypothetical protein N7G274_010213 [Stereocaulon virgatum]|uniref:Uncharacterized protein n=1 Tax=Stereocaulon virgatum TaxID=373712 RepID=A0ABR3ZWN1_9LECA
MTSYETAIRTIDFASRHSISGPTTQIEQNVVSSRKYLLRQTLPTTQTLELASTSTSPPITAAPSPSYSVLSHPKGGFVHRRPHMVITKHEGGLNIHLAEVRFESRGYDTIIAYKGSRRGSFPRSQVSSRAPIQILHRRYRLLVAATGPKSCRFGVDDRCGQEGSALRVR